MRTRRFVVSQETSCFVQNRTNVRSCNTAPCPCPHVPTQWSGWSECSSSCGGGVQRRSRETILGAGSSCLKHVAHQNKTCNMDSCPDRGSWWDFLDGEVFKGLPSSSATKHCYDDIKLLPLKAEQYFVGMGREYIDKISPVNSVCGACILFTTLQGKVNEFLSLSIILCNFQTGVNICPKKAKPVGTVFLQLG